MIDLEAVYARHAAQFDRVRHGSTMEQPYLDRVLAQRPNGTRLLDVGCGSGEPIARSFSERGWSVTGVDRVEALLQLCRERFADGRWIQCDMRQLDLGETFDVVLAWDSFFHLGCDDQRATLEVFRRHTAPGGVLMFTSGVDEGEGESGDLFGDRLFHGSLSTAEYRQRLQRLGYEIVLHAKQDPHCGGHTVWIARLPKQ